MSIPQTCIKPFPDYEDVFNKEIEEHKKHFLPLCSINLKFLYPEWDEWIHIVSVKEIYDGSVGETTRSSHTNFTKEDMIGFDVADGKYAFEGNWDYFSKDPISSEAYIHNDKDYRARKEFYASHQHIYPYSSFGEPFESAKALEDDFDQKQKSGWGLSYPEVHGVMDDIRFTTSEGMDLLEDCESEEKIFDYTNLLYVPKDEHNRPFTYIGFLTGYYFQAYGADRVYLFYNQSLKKAVVCFEYT